MAVRTTPEECRLGKSSWGSFSANDTVGAACAVCPHIEQVVLGHRAIAGELAAYPVVVNDGKPYASVLVCAECVRSHALPIPSVTREWDVELGDLLGPAVCVRCFDDWVATR